MVIEPSWRLLIWSGTGIGCPGKWWSPSLEVFKKHVDVALQDMV